MRTLSVSGGTTHIDSIADFTATGSITYFWAGSQVQGTATVRALATGLSSSTDIISHLTATDFFIDPTTYQIPLVRDAIHPPGPRNPRHSPRDRILGLSLCERLSRAFFHNRKRRRPADIDAST